jgi:hypothetical protein
VRRAAKIREQRMSMAGVLALSPENESLWIHSYLPAGSEAGSTTFSDP